jgi:hypothetical protein
MYKDKGRRPEPGPIIENNYSFSGGIDNYKICVIFEDGSDRVSDYSGQYVY